MIYASPTSLARHGACRRKQAYARRIKEDRSSESARFGTRLHEVAAAWLRDGTPPDPSSPEGECVLAGLPYLPFPGTCLHVEEDGGFETLQRFEHGGIVYVFRVDFAYLYDLEAGAATTDSTNAAVVVADHKSCGRLDRTEFPRDAKPRRREPLDLTDDLQRLIYGEWALREYPDFATIGAHWQYYQRKPAGHTFALFVLEDRAVLHERFVRMHESKTLALARDHGASPEDLPRNLDACKDYGGCPYRPECHEGVDPVEVALATIRRK